MAPYALNKLKAINIGLYYDYMVKYKRAMKEFEKNNK
jgi:hypothetical protein